jgi:hypothetical protein
MPTSEQLPCDIRSAGALRGGSITASNPPWGQRIMAVLYVGGVAALAASSQIHWLLRAVCIGMLSVWFVSALFAFWIARVTTEKQRP